MPHCLLLTHNSCQDFSCENKTFRLPEILDKPYYSGIKAASLLPSWYS